MDGGAWWAAVHGVVRSWTRLRDFTFTFHFHALEKEMAAHSSVLAWRIPGTGEPGGLPSIGSHRVGHDWSDLAAAAAGWLYKGRENRPWRMSSCDWAKYMYFVLCTCICTCTCTLTCTKAQRQESTCNVLQLRVIQCNWSTALCTKYREVEVDVENADWAQITKDLTYSAKGFGL